ncbi:MULTISPECIES: ribosome maturation factor RimP [unclassified Gemella]|uniref:ribosome maturation factor RimP n=1 Tax=unclassified Gemella TaxID=2624949 RepID=UPI0015CF8DA1|nr:MULTISPECIES: ribosome maturation factor RimP [unclassified Gemella]MBF0710070.1 ribosome maturation factor RimP [Gemella sp. GL1.1]NYS27414.1 ribosome maturation factor RimP [Gemella sp. GL1]
MAIIDKVRDLALKKVEDTEYSLYDVEYVKEGTDYFLRVYFDKKGGLNLDDCVTLTEMLSDDLDKEDFIKDNYYLEISSPGIEKELRSLKEVVDSIGEHVCIKTYEKIDGIKEFYADILEVNNEELLVEYKDKAKIKKAIIPYEKISKIRLAVKF